jgi:hypothetical protein
VSTLFNTLRASPASGGFRRDMEFLVFFAFTARGRAVKKLRGWPLFPAGFVHPQVLCRGFR